MGIGNPVVTVTCDRQYCDYATDYGLTPLAGHGWDARNLKSEMRRDGWTTDGAEQVCPDCSETGRDLEKA